MPSRPQAVDAAGSPVTLDRLALARARGFTAPGAGVPRRAELAASVRAWLSRLWLEATDGEPATGLALAAVGSLARGDAGPMSDVDLLLLHTRGRHDADVAALADRLWYPVWDAGIRLDHAIRTVDDCRAVARADLSAAVGLLDLTCVAGDSELVARTRSAISRDWRATSRQRLDELTTAVAARHARHGELAQSIEPDLKEARGGLRDRTILWALAEAWLADHPRDEVDAAHAVLLDVRDALHVVTQRSRNRLHPLDHADVAALLGLADAEELLTGVADAGRTIAFVLDHVMRRAGQARRARTLRVGPRQPRMRTLRPGLHESDGELVLGRRDAVADEGGELVLRAAAAAGEHDLPIAPATLANLAQHALDNPLPSPWPEAARRHFVSLLACGPALVPVWESLDQVGVIDQWLPKWAAVRSRPQHNAVHRHTVDRHLLETVVQAAGHPGRSTRGDLLVVSALLHDIGKIRGAADHSRTGAAMTEQIAARLGFAPGDAATLVTLVREHLTLIELATGRDPDHPETVRAALEAVGAHAETFELLVALSVADAAAVGGAAWTPWRSNLLDRLVTAARRHLSHGAWIGSGGLVREAGADEGPQQAAEPVDDDPEDPEPTDGIGGLLVDQGEGHAH